MELTESRLEITSMTFRDLSFRTDMTILGREAKVMIATLTFISKLKICGGDKRYRADAAKLNKSRSRGAENLY